MTRVCVVGLGNVGAPTAVYLRQRGVQVFGYDLVEKFLEGLRTYKSWEDTPSADVYVIAVPSHVVRSACQQVSSKNKRALVAVESTVQVGTCRKISDEFGLGSIVHCPHRYWGEDPAKHGVHQLRVIGGLDEESLALGLKFYGSLDIPLHVCPTIEIAEMCKIAENAYRFVHIAFAEELRMICEAQSLSFDKVREACNTKWNTEILEAREGILGECLPKDTGYLKALADSTPLIDGAILTDQTYRNIHHKTNRK